MAKDKAPSPERGSIKPPDESLFDSFETRPHVAPQQRRHEFNYLNETGIPIAAPIRALLERAFANFTGDRNDLRQRFRSADNSTHAAAALEIILHEIMVQQKLSPSAPKLPGGGRPDMRIALPTGGTALVEARMLNGSENVHYRGACDAVDSVQRQNILLNMRIIEEPSEAIAESKLISQVTAFVHGLDMDLLEKATRTEAPEFDFRGPGVHLRFRPVFMRGSPGGLGSFDIPGCEMPDAADIRKGLRKKKGKYKESDEPYVVAISSAKGFVDDDYFEEALFRKSRGDGEDRRGLWAKGQGSRVSAVLACYNFKPSSLHGARMQLFRNPHAKHPLGSNPFGCEELRPDADGLVGIAGASVTDLLNMPADWTDRG